jgi:hypothetical protein
MNDIYANRKVRLIAKSLISFMLLLAVFYWAAYSSVSLLPPSSIPVHHDDYSNYAASFDNLSLYIRPLSTLWIAAFSSFSPDALIWSVRLLSVMYVSLCLALFGIMDRENYHWLSVLSFAVILFSSPMVAEYARYTGMVTHLISGCLGVFAVICLRQALLNNKALFGWLATVSLLLSVMAKEDFLLLYALSYCYFYQSTLASKGVRWIGFAGMPLSVLLIIGYKVFSATQFLGVTDPNSTYHINITPISIIKTAIAYLSGAGHPALIQHGNVVIFCVFTALLVGILIRRQYGSPVLYFLGSAFSIMAPYTLLPNHVNAYYEYLWLPFIFFAVYAAAKGALLSIVVLRNWTVGLQVTARAALIGLAILVATFDYPGRLSVAAWYDHNVIINSKVLGRIAESAGKSQPNETICVLGANTFSPWYLHDGRYLQHVMGLHNKWRIYLQDDSPNAAGFQTSTAASAGRISVASLKDVSDDSCNTLDLRLLGNV